MTGLAVGTAVVLTGVLFFISCRARPFGPTGTPLPPVAAPTLVSTEVPPLASAVTPTLAPTLAPTAAPPATAAPIAPPAATPVPTSAVPNYYVDSVAGSDSNSGRSPDRPWRTLQKVENFGLRPGDVVNFKRGSSWSGGLTLKDSGEEGSPIVFRDYGTGNRPSLSNPGQKSVVDIRGRWIVVQGLFIQDAVEAGILIEGSASNSVVRDDEITNAGLGVEILGPSNLVTGNYAHDLHMVVNTPQPKNDDYGAVGFWIQAPNNEVSYNRCVNCRADSYDYGHDGGVVEIFDNGDNSYVHHNYGIGSEGFLEVGRGSARNVRIAYNVSDNDYAGFLCLHTDGRFSSAVDNLRVENNTIVKTMKQESLQLDCMDSISPSQLLFQNNIVYSSINVSDRGSFTHTHNIYFMIDGASVGFPLGPDEKVADPLFVSLDKRNYHLLPNSPAIGAGIDLQYHVDFDDRALRGRTAPDIGAFQFAP